MKHLILTGKNGSGKTSVVEALAEYLSNKFAEQQEEKKSLLRTARTRRNIAALNGENETEIIKLESDIGKEEEELKKSRSG